MWNPCSLTITKSFGSQFCLFWTILLRLHWIFEATTTGNNKSRSENVNWESSMHGHLSTLIVMLQVMQVTILISGIIWSAFPQLLLMQDGPTFRVVTSNSGQHNFGCICHLSLYHFSSVFWGLIHINLVSLYLHHSWWW